MNTDNHLNSSQPRSLYLDFLRGVATFLVIWGHLIQTMATGGVDFFEDPVFKTIYTFHMPLFMCISGYVFYWSCIRRSLIDNLVKRAFSMGIPMLTWGLINYFWENWNTLPNSILEITISICKRSLAVWFLWAVFLASVFVATIYSSVKNIRLRYILICIAGSLICILPGNEDLSLFVYPYFVLGFLANEKKVVEQPWYAKFTIAALLIWLFMLPFYQNKHYIYLSGAFGGNPAYAIWEQIQIDLFRFCIGLVGSIGIISILGYFYRRASTTRVVKWFAQLGKHSLELFVMQSLFLSLFIKEIVMKMFSSEWHAFFAVHTFVFDFVITLPLSVVCATILLFVSLWIEKHNVLNAILFGKIFSQERSAS